MTEPVTSDNVTPHRAAVEHPIVVMDKAELFDLLTKAVAAGIQVIEGNPKLAFTVLEVAEMLGVGERTVYSLISSGQLEVVRISGTPDSKNPALRVTRASIDAYLARI